MDSWRTDPHAPHSVTLDMPVSATLGGSALPLPPRQGQGAGAMGKYATRQYWQDTVLRGSFTLSASTFGVGRNVYLTTKHFIWMVAAAVGFHLGIMYMLSLWPKEEVTEIPVRTMNLKLGDGPELTLPEPTPAPDNAKRSAADDLSAAAPLDLPATLDELESVDVAEKKVKGVSNKPVMPKVSAPTIQNLADLPMGDVEFPLTTKERQMAEKKKAEREKAEARIQKAKEKEKKKLEDQAKALAKKQKKEPAPAATPAPEKEPAQAVSKSVKIGEWKTPQTNTIPAPTEYKKDLRIPQAPAIAPQPIQYVRQNTQVPMLGQAADGSTKQAVPVAPVAANDLPSPGTAPAGASPFSAPPAQKSFAVSQKPAVIAPQPSAAELAAKAQADAYAAAAKAQADAARAQAKAAAKAREVEIRRRYEQLLSGWIAKHKVYPAGALLLGQHGSVVVRLRIDRGGNVKFSAIEKSSGFKLIDKAALDMVRRANPVPAVPTDYPSGTLLEFLVPANFNLK